MKVWPVQDAKSQFSHVIELAQTEGPQTITRHGKPVAVMVSAKEFKRCLEPDETPLEFFKRFRGLHLEPRRKDLPREIQV